MIFKEYFEHRARVQAEKERYVQAMILAVQSEKNVINYVGSTLILIEHVTVDDYISVSVRDYECPRSGWRKLVRLARAKKEERDFLDLCKEHDHRISQLGGVVGGA